MLLWRWVFTTMEEMEVFVENMHDGVKRQNGQPLLPVQTWKSKSSIHWTYIGNFVDQKSCSILTIFPCTIGNFVVCQESKSTMARTSCQEPCLVQCGCYSACWCCCCFLLSLALWFPLIPSFLPRPKKKEKFSFVQSRQMHQRELSTTQCMLFQCASFIFYPFFCVGFTY